MKNFIIKVLLAWVISSFFGIFLLLHGSSDSFFRIALPLWILYGITYGVWIIFLYLIIQIGLYYFNIIDKNVFFGVGLVGLLLNGVLQKFKSISTIGDFLFYMPSVVLIIVGLLYWLWQRARNN